LQRPKRKKFGKKKRWTGGSKKAERKLEKKCGAKCPTERRRMAGDNAKTRGNRMTEKNWNSKRGFSCQQEKT